jgi:hypothetical protein
VRTSGASASPWRAPWSTRKNGIWQFIDAYSANYVTNDGRLFIDDPEVRRSLLEDGEKGQGQRPKIDHSPARREATAASATA